MSTLDRLYDTSPAPCDYASAYADHLSSMLKQLDIATIGRVIEMFLAARETGNRIFFCGNGGSAATASHFANDIAIGTRSPQKPFRAVSLTDNVAVITAIANDDGYDHIFVQQLQTLMEPGDLVVAISASGNSQNVVAAVEYANAHGNPTIALTGFDGGKLKVAATVTIHINSLKGDYGPVEDMHMVLDHMIGSYLMRAVIAK